jgi:membrane-associated protease RseP (regulator of RpoE activity)
MKLSILSAFFALSIAAFPTNQAFQSSTSSRASPFCTGESHSKRSPYESSFYKERHGKSRTQLEASPLTILASSPLGAISVLAAIVVVHEAGHYLAARSFNISVEEFSVGFGPKLAGFKAFGNEFNLRAFPLGGFVRFPENYDTQVADEKSKLAFDAFAERRQEEEWTWKEDLLNSATFGMWDERRRKQRKSTEAEQAEQAAQGLDKRPWWQKLGSKKTSTPSEDPEDFKIQYYDDPNLLQNRPWTERAVVLSGGVIFNLILSFLIYFGEIGPLGNGIPQQIFDNGVIVSQAPSRNGPSEGMLNKGDIIVGINGKSWLERMTR